MSKADKFEQEWNELTAELANKFADGDTISVESVIYLIGVQELGKGPQKFSKDDKINLMHIAICRLLEPFGYYEFEYFDEAGWPHYKVLEQLPSLKAGEQSVLMKEAIVQYFVEKEVIN